MDHHHPNSLSLSLLVLSVGLGIVQTQLVALPDSNLTGVNNTNVTNATTPVTTTITTPAVIVTTEAISFVQDPTQVPLDLLADPIPLNSDLAICTCDLTKDVCDVNCCCDENCSPSDRVVFSTCVDESLLATESSDLCTYDKKIYIDNSVTTETVNNPNIFCIWKERNVQRNYYTPLELVKSKTQFENYTRLYSGFTYRYDQPLEESTDVAGHYKSGQLVVTLVDGRFSTLPVPTSVACSSSCVDHNPAKFLMDESHSCMRNLPAPLSVACESTDDLSSYKLQQSLKAMVVKAHPGTTNDVTIPLTVKGTNQIPIYSKQLCIGVIKEVEYVITHKAGVIVQAEATIILSDLPGTLNAVEQKYSVKYIEANVTSIPYKRSGNPGYIVGEPLVVGQRVDDYIDLNGDRNQYLTMVTSTANGDCITDSLNRQSIVFGTDFRSGCILRLTKEELGEQCGTKFGDQCSSLNNYVIQALLGPSHSIDLTKAVYVATFGNSSPSKIGDWIKLEIINADIPDQAVGVSLHLDIIYANVGSLANPQARIVGAKLHLEPISVDFFCVGPYCQSQNADKTQNFEMITSVAFIDHTLPAEAAIAEKPVAKSKLSADFFKPYYITNSGPHLGVETYFLLVFILLSSMFV